MTNSQSDRLDMFKATTAFIDATMVISSTRPGLIAGKDSLNDLIKDIEEKASKQSNAIGGNTEEKKEKKELLAQQLYLVTSGTKAFAASTNNDVLQGEMNYSITELRTLLDDLIVPFTENIVVKVTPHLGAPLTAFGVDAAAMAALDDAKKAYSEVQSKPRLALSEKAAQTSALPPLFDKATKVCKEILDPTAATLKVTEPDWFSNYSNVRKIVNTGSGTTALDGTVKDVDTDAPLYNVEVTISAIGEPDMVIFTDVNGIYKKVPIKRGVYKLTFKVKDYNDVEVNPFEIKQGQTVTKNVVMGKMV